MSAKTIRSALGVLQDDPENDKAWQDLRDSVGAKDAEISEEELTKLLEAARRAHEMRREYEAVARMLEVEVTLARDPEKRADRQTDLARVYDEELLDDERAGMAYLQLLELRPTDQAATEAIEKSDAKRTKWKQIVDRYVAEASSTSEHSFKSSLLVSAAEIAYRFGRPAFATSKDKGAKKKLDALNDEIVGGLREALEIDPKNRRATLLLERVYRELERWEDLAKLLEAFASDSSSKEDKIAGFIRLARVLEKKLKSPERATAAYERVLDLAPGHPEATSRLVEFFNERQMWDHLVALYDEQLKTGAVRAGQEVGTYFQIAMVHWRMRSRPDAAEPYFEKLRASEPAHPGMLAFFREWCGANGETARLSTILADAQRALPDGADRTAIVAELAKLAEEGANAQKAIEQWRSLLRQDPSHKEARAGLKRLYKQTANWNALADLLRGELERIPAGDAAARVPVLRDIAQVYREHARNDASLVTVLAQITALDPTDREALHELAGLYETTQRWRDLLTAQARLAELEPEATVKAELWRAIARRWLEQFTNVQNAVEAYEKLHQLDPADREAIEKLKELYTKRRAYRPLYDLLEQEASSMPAGAERRERWLEMAKLAAERLDKGSDAVALYKRVLEEEPGASGALDALEKQAERDKDFATVAEVLERRVASAPDDAARSAVLQKLGAVYADRLKDHAGAMRAWRRVLEIQPGHAKALRVLRDSFLAIGDFDGLAELYAASNDWEGLVDVVSGAADKAIDTESKIALSFRAAEIYEAKLNAPERAFRSYERVLAARSDDRRAAAALVPIYEKDEKWGRLPALYEVLLAHADDTHEKLILLGKLVDVTGHQLQDRAAAFGYARRAYALDPEVDGAVDRFEKAARASGQWASFVDELQARQKQKKVKKDEKRALRAKLAEVYATELGKVDESVTTYKALVEEDESDDVAVRTLDKILRAADRRDDLRWLFEIRVGRANTAQKIDLLSEWAVLEEEVFSANDNAASVYKRLLELVPQHGGALRALSRLLRASGDVEGAANALERDRDQRQGEERAAREVELARLYADSLKRPTDALDAARRAMDIVPNDPTAIAVIEDLLRIGETRAQAAAVLEHAYAATGSAQKQSEVLEVMLAAAASRDDRISLYQRLADVHENALSSIEGAFDVTARAVDEYPQDLDVWDRLAVLANKTGRAQRFVDAIVAAVPPEGETGLPANVEIDLSERAATLYEEKLGEIDRAKPYLERILARDPSNDRAFHRLKQILTTREQWVELEAMYERAIGATREAPRRAELLAEVALVAEEITSDRPKAIGYYERILEIDGQHEQAVRSLEALYAADERWDRLAALLRNRLASAATDDALAIKLRLGTLAFSRLGDPATALSYLEEVLRDAPSNDDARQLVEKMLEVPATRAHAAAVLEGAYTERDEVAELVRVLEIRLESAHPAGERRDLLRRVAELRDERLRDDASALEAFARLVPIDTDDARARNRLLEIARRLGAHERAVAVLTEAASNAGSPLPRAEILMDVARLLEDFLHDSARAEGVYKSVLEIAADDAAIGLPATRSLERLYAAAGKSEELANVLRIEVKLEDSAEARREIWGRLGELYDTVLGNSRGAIEAWRARLDEDATDERSLVALDRLYERAGEWRSLVEVLRSRERQTTDLDARKALMVRAASTLGEKLVDVEEAILAYRAIVDDFGADRASLTALAMLYELAERWPDVGETLEAELGLADSIADRLALLSRLETVRRQKLADVTGAIEACRQALSLDATHAPSRATLESLLDDSRASTDAAEILRPLYEADGEQGKLLRVLDIQAEHAASAETKLSLLAQASTVAEGPLADAPRAFAYAARGLRDAVAEPEFPQWIERVERLAAATARYGDLVALLREIVGEILDGDVQLGVTRRVAELARTRLDDVELSKTYYIKALELRSDDRASLLALESIYADAKDASALLDVLRRRAESAESDAERTTLLYKQARLSDESLGDPRGAVAVYEQIIESNLDAEAVSALERLYSATERWDDLVALHERQLGQSGLSNERKAQLHFELGSVVDKRLHEPERAFDEYKSALDLDPQHSPTVAALEALLQDRGHAARAAEMLEAVYLARLDWRRVMATLDARLGVSEDPDERRQLLRRLAKLYEEQEENYGQALETTAKLLSEDVTDETTWAELERLARVASAEARLAEIFASELDKVQSDEPATAQLAKRTGELFEAKNDVESALKFYRRAYAFDPEASTGAFEAIDRLLRESNRPRDRVALYKEALDFRNDPKDRLTALHTIALLEDAELHEDAAAIDTYRAALDVDEGDQHALEALARLLARTERWRELADLTRRRAEQSALPEDEAKFRVELGKLLETRLEEASAALDEYEAVVELTASAPSPARDAAIAAFEARLTDDEHKSRVVDILRPIYERSDDWRNLVRIGAQRFSLANDAGEKVAVLRETARLWEERGNDLARAFEATREAFVLDPEDGAVREDLDRLAALTSRWDALADAYEQAIGRTDGVAKRELLSALAKLHDQKRDDPRRALDAWERLFALDETDLVPLEEMDSLATLLSDWSTLVRVLAKKAELLMDDESRASTWRRIGEARRDMLDDAAGAIDAYERALELEPASAFTMDSLIALYESKNDAVRLVDLYRRRVDLCGEDDQGLKYQLLVDAANRYETGLGDRREAIQSFNDALAVRPGDPESMKRLDALYGAEKMWPELLDNLRLQAGASTDPAAKRALKGRIGDLLAGELEDHTQALEAYREVLDGGFDEHAATAIRKIGEERDELRAEAADALEPVLRAAARFAELADVLELRLRSQTEVADRSRTLRAVAQVAESHLGDARRAEAALLRALAEEPHDATLHEEIERLCGQLGVDGWRRYADALSERASAIFDATVTTDLYVRLGRIVEEHLGDDARAAKAYVNAAERSGDSAPVLGALDRLYGRLGDARALAEVLERRVALEAGASEQADLYHRLASLQIKSFDEKGQGLATLRLALERVHDHAASREALEALLEDSTLFEDAFEALEVVYRALGQSEDIAKLYERRVTRAQDLAERTRARLDLARTLEQDVHDPARGQRVVEAAIGDDPANDDALAELERLAPITSGWDKAAEALAAALAAGREVPRATLSELWVRLGRWRRDKLSDARGAEDALASALALDPENVEILRSLEDLRRAPGRERELVATLRTRAKLETDVETKRTLLREAKAIAESAVGDVALAEETLRDLLAEQEGDLWALEELTRLRETAGDFSEVVALLLKRAELVADGVVALELKHGAARVATAKLGDTTRAISLYEEILETEPSDVKAATSLRGLYAAAGLDRDLAKLLARLVDVATAASERSTLRLELARLQANKFDSPEDAIDTLRAVIDEEPGRTDAVAAISALYEKTGKDAELADLLKTQLEGAVDRGDVASELELLVRLGEMYEGRLGDVSAAQESYERVLARDSSHRGALDAIARMSESRSTWDRAAAALEQLVELSTNGAGVAYALRLAAAREKLGDMEAVGRALRRALDLDPSNAGVRGELRGLYEKEKKWSELSALLVGDADLIAAANPDAKVEAAPATATAGKSIAPAGASVAPPPVVPAAIAEQVKILRRAADIQLTRRESPNDAIPILERATALVPHDRELLLALCDAYNGAQRGRDAATVLEKIIASFGTKRTKELALYHHRLGRALSQLGDKDQALAQFDLAFKIDPGSVTVLRDLGALAFETNDLERAQKTFRALLLQRLDPAVGISKGEVFYYLGEISAKQGDKAKALQMLERALENEPTLDKAKTRLVELKG
jgi:tetratricopeptide (TPR) repeat protein